MKFDYRISLWNYSHYVRRFSLERAVDEIVSNGYGVELWPNWQDDVDLFDEVYRERLKVLLQGVRSSWHTGGARDFEANQRQIDTAAYVGSDVVVVHAPTLALGEENPDYGLAREVVAYASEKGVMIALENGPLALLAAAMEQVDDLKICIDTGHVYFTDNPMKAYVDTLKPRLVHLHLQDTLPNTDHYFLGSGIIPREDWEYLAAALMEISFSGAAVFEIRPRVPLQTAEVSVRFFNEIAEGVRG